MSDRDEERIAAMETTVASTPALGPGGVPMPGTWHPFYERHRGVQRFYTGPSSDQEATP